MLAAKSACRDATACLSLCSCRSGHNLSIGSFTSAGIVRRASVPSALRVQAARRTFVSGGKDLARYAESHGRPSGDSPPDNPVEQPSLPENALKESAADPANGPPYDGVTHTSFRDLQFATRVQISSRMRSMATSRNQSISSMLASKPPFRHHGKPYPPPTPRVSDPLLRALALGVNRYVGEVQRREVNRRSRGRKGSNQAIKSDWYLEDNSRLEYVGDGVLWATTRLLVYRAYPDLSAGGIASIVVPLVSNDTLQLLWDVSGLDEFRLEAFDVAVEQMEERVKAEQVAAGFDELGRRPTVQSRYMHPELHSEPNQASTDQEQASSSAAPLQSGSSLRKMPIQSLTKNRKADHFEAYVAAVYLDLGPQVVSSWLEELYAPYVARMREYAALQGEQERWLTNAARARRAEESRAAMAEAERRQKRAEERDHRERLAMLRQNKLDEEIEKKNGLRLELEQMGTLRKTLRSVSKTFVGWVWPEIRGEEIATAQQSLVTSVPNGRLKALEQESDSEGHDKPHIVRAGWNDRQPTREQRRGGMTEGKLEGQARIASAQQSVTLLPSEHQSAVLAVGHAEKDHEDSRTDTSSRRPQPHLRKRRYKAAELKRKQARLVPNAKRKCASGETQVAE